MSMKNVVSIGFDGGSVAASDRERWVLTSDERDRLYSMARSRRGGLVILSTCYRFELFAESVGERRLRSWLHRLRPEAGLDHLQVRHGEAALRHVFRVTAGLNSAVLGEAQILGQVRRARGVAQQARTLTPVLEAAFTQAVETGRIVRVRTDLGRGATSTASAAVRLAQEAPNGLRNRHVVVVGAGEMGRLLLKHLPDAAPARVTVVTHHVNQVEARFEARSPEYLSDVLATADVVFTATRRRVLDADTVRRAGRPLTVIDLGLPRNVAPEAGDVPGVQLHGIDTLACVMDESLQRRQAAVAEAEVLIDEGLRILREMFRHRHHRAVVHDLRRKAERIRREALTQHAEPATEAAYDRFSRMLMNRLLHDLTNGLRRDEALNVDPETLRALFSLDQTHV